MGVELVWGLKGLNGHDTTGRLLRVWPVVPCITSACSVVGALAQPGVIAEPGIPVKDNQAPGVPCRNC